MFALGQVGLDVHIRAPFTCELGSNIHLGSKVFINTGCVFLDMGLIWIGDRTMIGPGVHIYTGSHATTRGDTEEDTLIDDVIIGSRVWIGGGAIILPGVTIGDGATVGAGSVVTKSVPEGVTVKGNPARGE